MYIARQIKQEILLSATSYPIVTIIGPKQSGKTTLVKNIFPDKPYASMEDPDIRNAVTEDPRSFLDKYPDGLIIDEV